MDKAKEELRSEMRAELQGAQSAAEFMGAVTEQPKLQLLELDGYYRLRWQNLNHLNLKSGVDSAGYNYFPKTLSGGSNITTANMRLRLEPTINASEMVRVRAQIDVLDNYVLGSNAGQVTDGIGSPYPVPFYGDTRTYTPGDKTNDRDPIIPRRVWGEVQTPVGLLSFGRMPSSWGLGIMANSGTGLDQDFGDTVDRIQFALPPVSTPLGDLIFVPILDYDLSGVQIPDPHGGQGTGQPLDAGGKDAGRTYALKIARLDTEEEIRRKLERGERSVNYGLYYNYRTQTYVYPAWLDQGYCGYPTTSNNNTCNGNTTNQYQDPLTGDPIYNKRAASGHYASLWGRWIGPKFRLEGELVGMYGSVGNAYAGSTDTSLGTRRLSMHQWGGVLQAEFKESSRFSWAVELGAASGDGAPGFGNLPNRTVNVGGVNSAKDLPNYGSIDGPQWGRPGDNTINNFRFNPAYQLDLILWRRILGQVTDAVYLRPSLRWNIISGLTLDTAAIYSQAQLPRVHAQLELEGCQRHQQPAQPQGGPAARAGARQQAHPGADHRLHGLDGPRAPAAARGMGSGTSLAWVFEFGLAAKF